MNFRKMPAEYVAWPDFFVKIAPEDQSNLLTLFDRVGFVSGLVNVDLVIVVVGSSLVKADYHDIDIAIIPRKRATWKTGWVPRLLFLALNYHDSTIETPSIEKAGYDVMAWRLILPSGSSLHILAWPNRSLRSFIRSYKTSFMQKGHQFTYLEVRDANRASVMPPK